jgi:hypothetical protein
MSNINLATIMANAAAAQSSKTEATNKAEYWLNVGYYVDLPDGSKKFVSLPLGIPMDNQKVLQANSRNEEFNQLQAARNELHQQIMEFMKTLAPGEEATLKLTVQARRTSEQQAAPDTSTNPFARKVI